MDTRWIKCRGVFRHGVGPWEYLEFTIDYSVKGILELIHENIRTDSEGIRSPEWAFIQYPPTEWLDKEIRGLERQIEDTEKLLARRKELRRSIGS